LKQRKKWFSQNKPEFWEFVPSLILIKLILQEIVGVRKVKNRTHALLICLSLVLFSFAKLDHLLAQKPGEWVTFGPAQGNPSISVLLENLNNPSIIYAGTTDRGVYFTTSAGILPWRQANFPMNNKTVTTMIFVDGTVYAGTKHFGIFRSNNGLDWLPSNAPMNNKTIKVLIHVDETFYAGIDGFGVYRSKSGIDWEPANSPMDDKTVRTLLYVNEILYAGGDGFGVFRSTNGLDWEPSNTPMENLAINKLIYTNDIFFAGAVGRIYRSSNGIDWETLNPPIDNPKVTDLIYADSTLYVAVSDWGLFSSEDNGVNWSYVSLGLRPPFSFVTAMLPLDKEIIVGTQQFLSFQRRLEYKIFKVLDRGSKSKTANFPSLSSRITSMVSTSGALYASTTSDGVLRSTNQGDRWVQTSQVENVNIKGLLIDLNFILAYSNSDVFYSTDGGNQWIRPDSPLQDKNIRDIILVDGTLYAGTGLQFLTGFTSGAFRSTDGGRTWTSISGFGSTPLWIERFFILNSKFYALSAGAFLGDQMPPYPQGLFTSNNGTDWQHLAPHFMQRYFNITSMTSFNGSLYQGTGPPVGHLVEAPNGIILSSDEIHWSLVNTDIDTTVTTLLSFKDGLYAGTEGLGVFKSQDGLDWIQVGSALENEEIRVLRILNDRIYTGTNGSGLFFSDNGDVWSRANTPMDDKSITSLISIENILYAGTINQSVFRSLDNGENWTPLSTGLGQNSIAELHHFAPLNRLYAAADNGVFFQTLDTIPPTVDSIKINLGKNFTKESKVTVTLFANEADSVIFAEDTTFIKNTDWHGYDFTHEFVLTSGDGPKTIYAKFKDFSWNESNVISAQITLDTAPPSFPPHIPPTEAKFGQEITINQQVNETNLESIELLFRRAGESWDRNTRRITFSENTTIIDNVWISNKGIDYQITATDQAGQSDTLRNSNLDFFSIPVVLSEGDAGSSQGLPAGTNGGAYRLASVPMNLNGNPSVKSVFGDFGPYGPDGDWRFWLYQNDNEWEEGEDINLENGEAYFLILRDGGNLTNKVPGTTMETTAGVLGTISGWQLRGNAWNIIGNPYNTRISLSQLKLANQNLLLSAHPDTNAIDIWRYDGSLPDSGWTKNDLALEPWSGLAIWVAEADTVVFANPDDPYAEGPSGLSKHIADRLRLTEDLKEHEWAVNVTANGQGFSDKSNYFGVKQGAVDELDSNDWIEPPPVPGGVSVSFRPDWENPISLASDIRSVNENGYEWQLQLNGKGGKVVNLSLDNLESIPEELDVLLVDEAGQIVGDLRSQPHISVRMAKSTQSKNFRILVGGDDFIAEQTDGLNTIPQSFVLHQNYPNPFNPTTVIRYELPVSGKVTLKVYDLLGREVVALEDDRNREAGFYESVMDLTRFASGVYFYRISVTGEKRFEFIKKMLFVK